MFKGLGKLLSGSGKPKNTKTTKYTIQDNKGKTKYVGITSNPDRRFKQHAKTKAWWQEEGDKIKTKSYSTREKAAKAEKKDIKKKSPEYNIVHNSKARSKKQ
jgi:predicted GIY-YIG superfamily endonuclease